jgi:hypothetical protein
MSYIGVQPVTRATRVRTFGALASATTTIAIPGGFSPSNIEVFIDGLYVQPTDYDDSDGFNLVFITTLALGTEYVVMEARNFEVANHYTKVESDAKFVEVGDTVTGTATFANSTNNINLTNIGSIAGLEVGDVIKVSGSVGNNSEFTVEVITDANNVIVNQAHAGGSTTKSFATETSTAGVTVQLLVKWYSAGIGVGQGVVNVISGRSVGTLYTNATNRTISISARLTEPGDNHNLFIDGNLVSRFDNTTSVASTLFAILPKGSTYQIDALTGTGPVAWWELR